jgi:hypothetical protein
MNNEKFFLGSSVTFKKGIEVYPPVIKDVVANQNYGVYSRLLTYSQEEVEDEFVEAGKTLEIYPTPLEFMLSNAYHNKDYEKLCKEAFHFFLH